MKTSLQVGLLTIIAIALFVGAYFYLGETFFKVKSYNIYAVFTNVQGLPSGAKVMMAGVKIGKVEMVSIEGNQAKVTMSIDKDMVIPAGSVASIPAGSLFPTDLRIDIIPPPTPTIGKVADGETLPSVTVSQLATFAPEAVQTIDQLNKTLNALQFDMDKILNKSLTQTMANLDQAIMAVTRLTETARVMIATNQGNISQTLDNIAKASGELNLAMKEVNKLISDPNLRNSLDQTVVSLKATAANAQKLSENLNNLVSDPKLIQDLKDTTANISDITATGKEIAVNAKDMTATGKEVVANTRDITAQAKDVMADIKEITTQAKDITKESKKLVDRVNKIVGDPGKPKQQPQFNLDFAYSSETNQMRTDAIIRVPYENNAIIAGMYDLSESDKFIIQYEMIQSPKISYRYGLYASKPGFGVDYRASNKLELRTDIWDPNNLQFDVRARYKIGDNWGIWGGMDSIFNEYRPIIGVTLFR